MTIHAQPTTPDELQHQLVRTCTVTEACSLAQVSRRTIYNWMQQGKVEFVRTAGGAVRIVRTSLFRTGGK